VGLSGIRGANATLLLDERDDRLGELHERTIQDTVELDCSAHQSASASSGIGNTRYLQHFSCQAVRHIIDALAQVHSSPQSIMSTVPSTSTSQSNFARIFNTALDKYRRKTKKDLASHPLLPRLQSCNSLEAIVAILHEEIPASSQSESEDNGLTKPTVNVLLGFSATVGQGVGLVNIRIFFEKNFYSYIHFQAYPPVNAIFAGISILLSVGFVHVSLPQPIFTL